MGPIGVFDSGVGGLCVLKKCETVLPNERFIYLADKARMPYGERSADDIKKAALECAKILFDMNCKALVVACNTATATAVADMRRLYANKVIIGLEPALKPCVKQLGRSGYGVALVTPATARSEKFKRLRAECGDKIIVAEQPDLASVIESNMPNIDAIKPYVFGILEKYSDAEAVIFGCSHYSYIYNLVQEFYGGNIKIYDGADGAAERLKYCLSISGMLEPDSPKENVRFYSTYAK